MKTNIALLISILTLILLFFFLRVTIPKESQNLAGNLITEGIYGYDLDSENKTINGLSLKDNDVYYLVMETIDEEKNINNYQLKKLDIYKNDQKEIDSQNNYNSYCTLKEENIFCLTETSLDIYDLNFHKIFSYTSKEQIEEANYFPYKDIYARYYNNEIYLIRNKQEESYRTISSDNNLYYEDYFSTNSNTYIILIDEDGNFYLYDINENKLTQIKQEHYFKYENGIIFYNEKIFMIHDLMNHKIIEYENNIQEDYYYTGTFNKENSTFYLYDIIENKLFIENLNERTIQELDTTILSKDNPISKLIIKNNYLYIYVLQDKDNFYVIDINQLQLPIINIDEYENEVISNINTKINNIKDKYNVNIKIKDDAIIKFPDFSAEPLTKNELILESLNKIETILVKYDRSFFESFYNNGFVGLNLYLTGELTPSDYETQVANPAAYSLTFNGEYMIVIDLNQPNIEELLCHELLHNLEFNLNNQNIYPFKNWNHYNPTGFKYNNSYTSDTHDNYTLTEKEKENVYFIDYYSHTYETEDRARVFERICSCEEDSIVNEYPNLYEKGVYLKEEITKYYPNLNDTGLFNSLN